MIDLNKVSSKIGYVDENSEVGTFVVDESGKEIIFSVEDKDMVINDQKKPFTNKFPSRLLQNSNETSLKDYIFEMTTKSFKIDADGKLIVNEKNLDRDPPNENKLGFQVFLLPSEILCIHLLNKFEFSMISRFLFVKLMLKMIIESLHPL